MVLRQHFDIGMNRNWKPGNGRIHVRGVEGFTGFLALLYMYTCCSKMQENNRANHYLHPVIFIHQIHLGNFGHHLGFLCLHQCQPLYPGSLIKTTGHDKHFGI